MAIDARIKIDAGPGIADDDARHSAQHAELLEKVAALAAELGRPRVRVEVEYPSERAGTEASWDLSGDALEVDVSTDPFTISTLLPYSEVAP